MIYRPFAISLVFVGALSIGASLRAQTRAGTGFFPPASRSSQPRPMNFNRPAFRSGQAYRHHRYINYGPYFYPSFYPSDYAESTPEPLPPQGYEDEHAAASAAAPAKPAESMVVELRGDRWVRLTSSGPQEVVVPAPQASGGTTKSLAAFAQSSASRAASTSNSCLPRWPSGRSSALYHRRLHHLSQVGLLRHWHLGSQDSPLQPRRSRHTQTQSRTRCRFFPAFPSE